VAVGLQAGCSISRPKDGHSIARPGWVQHLQTQGWAVPCSLPVSEASKHRASTRESHLTFDRPSRLPDFTGIGCRTAKCVLTPHSKAVQHVLNHGHTRVCSDWDYFCAKHMGRCFSGLLPQCSAWSETLCLTLNVMYKRKWMPLFLSVCLGIKLSSTFFFFAMVFHCCLSQPAR